MAFARVDESPTLPNAMSRRLVWHCRRGNSRKFYTLTVERDLWGNRAIGRRWGRMDGGHTGVCIHWEPELSFADSPTRSTSAGAGIATSSRPIRIKRFPGDYLVSRKLVQ